MNGLPPPASNGCVTAAVIPFLFLPFRSLLLLLSLPRPLKPSTPLYLAGNLNFQLLPPSLPQPETEEEEGAVIFDTN